MTKPSPATLTRREREIMDILYRMGRASAAEVLEAMAEPPSYSAVRTHLRILEEKGHLRHTASGNKYIYSPRRARGSAARAAMQRVLHTFFQNSTEQAVAALLEMKDRELSAEELDRLAELIQKAKQEGR